MLLPIESQFKIVIFSFLAGLLTGALFDFYRIVRGYGVPKFIKIIEDILFWILCAAVIFTFLLYTNYAFLGAYVYLFIGIGLVTYIKIISNRFFNVEKKIGRTFLKGIRITWRNMSYGARVTFNRQKNNK